ncbi:hypothetical protein EDD18DRAFT_1377184 [Armillaria luteobubalina]|uniref:Alpha/beta hydrolase n=1 Tax=Armillaria luteobubalina TaxID=153913 RepID=A0AA39TS83_9AGAR|nr:hypothetical protein EDD18DRAFT_1377184 [Armillaria luteobubalina]
MALAAMFLFVGHASALTKNPVDACKDKKDDVGHSCAYDSSHGKVEGTELVVGRLRRKEDLRRYSVLLSTGLIPTIDMDERDYCGRMLVLHGLRENEADSQVHLKTSPINETVLYADLITPSTVYGLLHQLDVGIQLNWVLPENGGIIGPELKQKMIGLRPVNTKSVMIPGTSHFIPQDRPKDVADAILQLIDNRGHGTARL